MEHQVTVHWSGGTVSTNSKDWLLNAGSQYEDRAIEVESSVTQYLDYYFDNFTYYQPSYGVLDDRSPLLAFSYGEEREVNKELASLVVEAMRDYPTIEGILQWEIADLVVETNPSLITRITPVTLPENANYMTTVEVASKALELTDHRKANLIAQCWHASRCIRQAEEQGWHIVSLRGVDAFAANDPQTWVRHPLDWLIKESRFRYIEINEKNQIA